MSKSNPEFRKIPSLFFLYEISEDGRIVRNIKSKKQLKIFESDDGYYKVQISIKKKVYKCSIHRLIAECWLGECPEGYTVDHIDRNKKNNHYSNLRYATRSEQMINRNYDAFMPQLLKNLQKENILVTVGDKEFSSFRQASYWLESIYRKPWKHYCDQFSRSYAIIGGFEIKYSDNRDVYYPKYLSKPLAIKKDNDEIKFDSKTDACTYISELYGVPYTTVEWKLTKNKKRIYDFDIFYGM